MDLELSERGRPQDPVMIRVEFQTATQGTLRVALKMSDLQKRAHPVERMLREGPPSWLENPSREGWTHPQEPFTFKGTVKAGFEHEARKALGLR